MQAHLQVQLEGHRRGQKRSKALLRRQWTLRLHVEGGAVGGLQTSLTVSSQFLQGALGRLWHAGSLECRHLVHFPPDCLKAFYDTIAAHSLDFDLGIWVKHDLHADKIYSNHQTNRRNELDLTAAPCMQCYMISKPSNPVVTTVLSIA